VVIAKHLSPEGQRVGVELPGQLELTHLVEAVRKDMRRMQRVRMVATERSLRPGEGLLTQSAGVAVAANVGENTDERPSNPQGVPIVWAELLTPLLVKVLS
jgi:hypothetical protein